MQPRHPAPQNLKDSFFSVQHPRRTGFRSTSFARRLNDWGVLIGMVDATINLLSLLCHPIEEFFSQKIPFWANGLYYILPNFTCLFHCRQSETNEPSFPDAEELIKLLEDKHPKFKKFLLECKEEDKNENERNSMIQTINDERHDWAEFLINGTFFIFRTMHGIILIIRGLNAIDPAVNTKIEFGIDIVSNIITIAYIGSQISRASIKNLFCSHRDSTALIRSPQPENKTTAEHATSSNRHSFTASIGGKKTPDPLIQPLLPDDIESKLSHSI